MLNVLAVLPIISASIAGAVAIFFFLLFLRKPEYSIYHKFALTSLLVMFYAIASTGLYSSTQIHNALTWRRLQTTALSLFTVFFLDFILVYIRYQQKNVFRLIQTSAVISIVLQILITNDLTWKFSDAKITTINFLNQTVTFPDISPGIISIFLYGIGLFAYLYILYITFKQHAYIQGHKQTLIILSVVIFYFGFLNDTLISFKIIQSVYMISSALLILISLIAYSMIDTILEDARLKQQLENTNQKLETLTNQLEQRVIDRTLKLQDQAEFFQSLINNNPVGIAILDNEERITQTNFMFTEIFGYDQKETAGQCLDSLIAPEERYSEAVKLTQQVMNLEKVATNDVRRRKDGQFVSVEILGVPVTVKGKKVGGLGIYKDITERIEAEKRLKESEASYRSLFYDSPISLKEEDHSQARKILFGLKEQGINNISEYLLQHPELLKEILLNIKTVKVNNAAILLYKARNKLEVFSCLDTIVPESGYSNIAKQFETFMSGSSHFVSEMDNNDLNGGLIHAIVHTTIAPGYEETWEKVFVSILDNTERKINQRYLEYLSSHDQLTGLANRTLLFERLQHAIKIAQRNQTSIAIFFIDLDGFKTINDLHGHYIGDQLLSSVANRLQNSLRDSDTISRVGGDEFVLILENFKEAEILPMVADKILRIIARPYLIEEKTCLITTSIGISIYPKHSDNPEELISMADTAMYEAKHLGKNRFYIAT